MSIHSSPCKGFHSEEELKVGVEIQLYIHVISRDALAAGWHLAVLTPLAGSYRIHGSSLFHGVSERFVSQGPTPSVWPKRAMLSYPGGPCLSPSTWLRVDSASWSALRRLTFVLSHEARRGVTGFGPFCRNKRASPAGAKPGNTEHHVDTRIVATNAMRSPTSTFLWQSLRWIPDTRR